MGTRPRVAKVMGLSGGRGQSGALYVYTVESPFPLESTPVGLSAWAVCGLSPPPKIRRSTHERRDQANGQRNPREREGVSCEFLDPFQASWPVPFLRAGFVVEVEI